MKSILTVVAAMALVPVLVLCGVSVKTSMACPGSNSADLSGDTEVQAQSNGEFDIDLNAAWAMTDVPFLGGITVQPNGEGSSNIGSVDVSPSLWFPDKCVDDIDIEVSGNLEDEELDGVIYFHLVVGSGYPLTATDWHITLINSI